MPNNWIAADRELKDTIDTASRRFHPHLLGTVRIVAIYSEEPKKTKGKVALAYVQAFTGLNAWLADGHHKTTEPNASEGFILLSVWHEGWQELDCDQRLALIDHELSHISVEEDEQSGETKVKLVGHDLEEFKGVVERHGFWLQDITDFVSAARKGAIRQQPDEAMDLFTFADTSTKRFMGIEVDGRRVDGSTGEVIG